MYVNLYIYVNIIYNLHMDNMEKHVAYIYIYMYVNLYIYICKYYIQPTHGQYGETRCIYICVC